MITAVPALVTKGQVNVPGQLRPDAGYWVGIVEIILATPDIVMMDGFDNRPVAVVGVHIDICQPPRGKRRGFVCIYEIVDI